MHRVLWVLTIASAFAAPSDLRAQAAPPAALHAAPQKTARPLPTRRTISTIQGNALNWTNAHLGIAVVRLRDARYGRIVNQQTTDKAGFFSFTTVDPGMFVVEIIAPDNTILAASQLLDVSAGDAVSVVVKLPFKISTLAATLGHTSQAADAVTGAAASLQVPAAVVTTDASGDQIRK